LFRLILLFTALPFVELVLLLWVADYTSWQFALALVLVTGVVGAALARWQGLQTLRRIQEDWSRGDVPAQAVLDGILILLAGAVLITPGLLTDVAGFLLLVPFCRRRIRRFMTRYVRRHAVVRSSSDARPSTEAPPHGNDRIVDVRIIDGAQDAEDD